MNERPSPYNPDEAERAMRERDPDRNRNYETLRDSGCSHDLATALLGMGDEVARLKAELAAMKARRCETCKHWSRVGDRDFGICHFWASDKNTWHAFVDERCRNWQDKEAPDAAR